MTFGALYVISGMKLERRIKGTLILLIGLMSACSGSSKEGGGLIGDWIRAEDSLSCVNSFHRDGTFSGHCFDNGLETWVFSGDWSVHGDVLRYQYKESSLDRVPAGTEDTDKIIAVAPDYYIVEGGDGVQRKYRRSVK